jgi:hypothetical protein
MEPHSGQAPRREVVCVRCGTVFPCSLDGDCWCAAEPVRLPVQSLAASDDCLCAACLRSVAAGGNAANRD